MFFFLIFYLANTVNLLLICLLTYWNHNLSCEASDSFVYIEFSVNIHLIYEIDLKKMLDMFYFL